MLRKILVGFVMLLVAVVVGARVYLETFTRPRVEDMLSAALGTEVSIENMSLGLFAGSASFRNIAVRNPDGYRDPYLLQVGTVDLGVDLASLLEPEVMLERVLLDEVRIVLEHAGGRTNYGEVIDGLKSGEDAQETKGAGTEDGRSVVVEELQLTNVRASVHVVAGLGRRAREGATDAGAIELEIPAIRLADLGAEGTESEITTKVSREVLGALLRAIAEETVDLPGHLSRNLLSASRATGSTGLEILGDVSRSGGEALGHLPGLDEAGKSLGEGIGGAFDALGRMVESEDEKPSSD